MALKQRYRTVVALDVGAHKIACIVGKKGENESASDFEICGIGYGKSLGIESGSISDMRLATKSIKNAIAAAEKTSGEKVKSVFVSMSSSALLSHTSHCEVQTSGREINNKDINKLILSTIDKYKQNSLTVLHTFVYGYFLDNNKAVHSPIGLYADNMGCKINVISTQTNNILNLANCLAGSNVEIEGYVSSAYVGGVACLSKDELKLGVNFIEFGAGTTSVSIFQGDSMTYTDGIQIGMSHVTKDIARVLGISFETAERLKNLHGGCIVRDRDKYELIDIRADNGDKITIARETLIEIIRARIDEIIEMLIKHIDENNIVMASRTVISGGGGRLSDLADVVSQKCNTNTRIGSADRIKKSSESINLEMVTAIGLLSHGIEMSDDDIQYGKGQSSLLRWIKWMGYIRKYIRI